MSAHEVRTARSASLGAEPGGQASIDAGRSPLPQIRKVSVPDLGLPVAALFGSRVVLAQCRGYEEHYTRDSTYVDDSLSKNSAR